MVAKSPEESGLMLKFFWDIFKNARHSLSEYFTNKKDEWLEMTTRPFCLCKTRREHEGVVDKI